MSFLAAVLHIYLQQTLVGIRVVMGNGAKRVKINARKFHKKLLGNIKSYAWEFDPDGS